MRTPGPEPQPEPTTELDARYGEPDTPAVPWATARALLEGAEVFWITTLLPDGRPHVTPLVGLWMDGALHFTTGPEERKGRNLAANRQVALTTGSNALHSGTDVVVNGEAVQVTDDAELRRVAEGFEAKYGEEWHFDVADGAFQHPGGTAVVYRVLPVTVYAFGKNPYSHTRYTF